MELYTLHLFAGAGGGILADLLLEHRPIGAVEIEKYPRKVLLQRQLDGILPRFPIWDDVRTFRIDNPDCREYIERLIAIKHKLCICGGWPCQDISCAGKGLGLAGERSGLWSEYARIIREIRPAYAFVENSPMLTSRGLGRVLGDLAEMGYNARWGVLSCDDVGGVHLRERIWIKATNSAILHGNVGGNNEPNSECEISEFRNNHRQTNSSNHRKERVHGKFQKKIYRFSRFPWGEDVGRIEDLRNRSDIPQPLVRRIGNDVANGVDRISAIGNGQVPRVAATAWRILSE